MNTSSYKSKVQPGEIARSMVHKLMIIMLALAAPLVSIFGALNAVFRMPDFFRFEFDRLEVSKSLDLAVSDSELGGFFSDFMIHKLDVFSLVTDYQGIVRELFTDSEASLMNNFRVMLDASLIIAVVFLILMVFIIIIMYINIMAKDLRLSLNISLGIYIVSLVLLAIYFNVTDGDVFLVGGLLNGALTVDNLLPQMFDERFTMDASIAIFAISFIVMMIIRYVVWKMTAQKGIFSESLKGVGK